MHSPIDIALLSCLPVFLRERNVTRAARQLGITQSAASQRLRRLREALGDELLVPGEGGLILTQRAEDIGPHLTQALEAVWNSVARKREFDPRTARREFTIATTDYGELVALSAALRRLREEAPGVTVRVVTTTLDAPLELSRGSVDLVVGGQLPSTPHLVRKRVGEEGFLVLLRDGHRALRRRLDLDAYLAAEHVLIAPRNTPGGVVDGVLDSMGKKRRVALTLPHFVVAPFLVAHSDLLLTAPSGLARAMLPLLPLRARKPPLPLPAVPLELIWHARSQNDPPHQWFREFVADIVKEACLNSQPR